MPVITTQLQSVTIDNCGMFELRVEAHIPMWFDTVCAK